MAQRLCCGLTPAGVKLLIYLLAALVGLYILGPPLYWHLIGQVTDSRHSCPVCVCDCDTDSTLSDTGLSNFSLADCGSGEDPDLQKQVPTSKLKALEEELALQAKVATENQQRSDAALLDSKKLTSQYQKEAEKCNIGMETSEEARERAEAALGASRKLVALWESRARRLGWRDEEEEERSLVEDPHDPELVGAFSSFDDTSSFKKGRSVRYVRKRPSFSL